MKAYALIVMVLVTGLHAQAQDCSVIVYVNLATEIPLGMLFSAKRMATQMFREIGVKVRMVSGDPAREPGDACGAPIEIDFARSAHFNGSDEAMAYAAPYRKSGVSIHVLIDRLLRHDSRGAVFANTLLAQVMVHEITHVLQGVARHSDEGVMKAYWTLGDYQQMAHGPMPFTAEDVEWIRSGLASRLSYRAGE